MADDYVNPFEAPQAGGHVYEEDYVARDYGGIGRMAYFGYTLLNSFVVFAIMFMFGSIGLSDEVLGVLSIVVTILSYGVLFYIVYLRMKNLGYNGWWTLGIIVPILNILVGLRALAAPEGYADHKQLDTNGKIVIGVFFGLIILGVVAVILAAVIG